MSSRQISVSPRGYQLHFGNAGERIWPGTNCYPDLWIETLDALGRDPVARIRLCPFRRPQWSSMDIKKIKQKPEDLRRLYGLEVTKGSCGRRYWEPCLSTRPAGHPSDNFFNLPAAARYSVPLQRYCDQAAPLSKVASVDSLGTATSTASA